MASPNVVHVTQSNFDAEVLKSPVPVLLDFWAPWCGPCRQIAPILDEIAEESDGKFKIGKINVDEEQQLGAQFNVRSIPMLLFFKGGEVQAQVVGLKRKADLVAQLEALA